MKRDFGQAYEKHVWDVYGFLGYRLGNRADAEDLTQLTFERALRSWGRFDERRGTLRTWLLAIARNALVDHYRRGGRETPDSLEDDSAALGGVAPGPEEVLGVEPELAAALATLGDRDREVIALRYGADLTGPEIAEMLGLSVANVQQIVSRSLRRLRAHLEEVGDHGVRRGA